MENELTFCTEQIKAMISGEEVFAWPRFEKAAKVRRGNWADSKEFHGFFKILYFKDKAKHSNQRPFQFLRNHFGARDVSGHLHDMEWRFLLLIAKYSIFQFASNSCLSAIDNVTVSIFIVREISEGFNWLNDISCHFYPSSGCLIKGPLVDGNI